MTSLPPPVRSRPVLANAPLREGPSATGGRARLVRSPGGIEAWLVEDHTVPIVTLHFGLVGGSAHDPIGKGGMIQMLAALLDEGAGPLDASAFHAALADKAIQMSLRAGADMTHAGLRVMTRYLDDAVDLLRLAVNEPRFDPEPIERIRAAQIAEIKADLYEPAPMARRLFSRTAFGDHGYGRPSMGDVETVASVTRDDLHDLYRRVMTKAHLKVVAVGTIDADHLARVLDTIFGALPDGPGIEKPPAVAVAGLGSRVHRDFDLPQTYFRFGGPAIAQTDPDYAAAEVVNHILGGGSFTSRLWTEIRETRGLTYGISTQLHSLFGAAVHLGMTFTKNERAGELYEVLTEAFARMAADGPTDAEVEAAKTFLIGSDALDYDTSWKIAGHLLDQAMAGLGIDYAERYTDLIAAVTPDEARRVARRLYGDGHILVATVGRPQGLPA